MTDVVIVAEDKAVKAREGFLKTLRERRNDIRRDKPTVWIDEPETDSRKGRMRRFDLLVRRTRSGFESVSLSGRGGCSPALAVTFHHDFGDDMPSAPLERAMALLALAERLAAIDPSEPDDDAESLARVASFALGRDEAAVTVMRPMPWAPASIQVSAMRPLSNNGTRSFLLLPSATRLAQTGPHEDIQERLDRLALLAGPRLTTALDCVWNADGGGGHSFAARPSRKGGVWRLNEHGPLDGLRLCADWAVELAGSGLA